MITMALPLTQGVPSTISANPSTIANADDYIFLHGKRLVKPYYFEFVAHVKRRWAGKMIVDLFAQEFKGRPHEYYVRAVESGRILVEGRKVAPSFVVRDSQKVSHFLHRHEPPVLDEPVKILEETPDVIVVNKPPSMPVHPCGQYRKNTVVGVLEAEHNTGPLFPIHRLDRLVSGLLIFARNTRTANFFREEIEAGRIHKQYVAKVKGVFPEEKVEVTAAVIYNAREGTSSVESGGSCDDSGKTACTRFYRISTDGITSIVRCEPVTGRTHQIRVHLQHLGHPIANDDLYLQSSPPTMRKEPVRINTAAGEKMGGPLRSKETENMSRESPDPPTCTASHGELGPETVQACGTVDLSGEPNQADMNADERSRSGQCRESATDATIQEIVFGLSLPISTASSTKTIEDKGHSFSVDTMCLHCPNIEHSGYKSDHLGLWLHCVRYSSSSWSYECPLPEWTQCPATQMSLQ